MDEQEARQDIQIIKAMLDKAKKETMESGTLFIFWGVWIIVAIVAASLLAHFEAYRWIWVNWIAFAVIGWIFSMVYSIRRERGRKTKTYAQSATGYLVLACSVGYALAGFVFPALHIYSYDAIAVLISLVTGILLFVMGGLYEWPLLLWSGVLWWLGSVGIIFLPSDYRGLGLIPLLLFGYLIPGLVLRGKYRRETKKQDAR